MKLTNYACVGGPVWGIKDSIWLAGGDEKRSGKPVVVENLPLGADKGEVETYEGSRLKIWWGVNFILTNSPFSLTLISKANVANVEVAFYMNRFDLGMAKKMEEMGIAWLLVWPHKPPVAVTADPRIGSGNFHQVFYLSRNGSSRSMVVPSPGSPTSSTEESSSTAQRWINSWTGQMVRLSTTDWVI